MAHSVSLWFDEAAESQVQSSWQRLADAGIETFAGGPIWPHVTLAHGLEVKLEPFVKALRERLVVQPAFDLTFTSLGIFADSGILYLEARMTEMLWTLHRDVAALAEAQGSGSSPYYRPDLWTPHCTLATNLTPASTLEAVCICQNVTPLAALVTRVGVIENPSERELLALSLAVV